MTPPPDYKTVLKSKNELTENVRDFVFELVEPNKMEFQAGNFVLVKTNHPETGEFLSRAYSIVNPPQESGQILLNVKILPDGKLTPVIESWEIGQEVTLQGPFGHFVLKSGPEKDLVFVGTGVGVAPLRCMIDDLLRQGDKRNMHLCFGVRHESDLFYQEFFEALAAEHENFTVHITLSQPQGDWKGLTGRVTSHLPEKEFKPDTDFYLCGGQAMIEEVQKMLLQKNIPEEQIYFERFF